MLHQFSEDGEVFKSYLFVLHFLHVNHTPAHHAHGYNTNK